MDGHGEVRIGQAGKPLDWLGVDGGGEVRDGQGGKLSSAWSIASL